MLATFPTLLALFGVGMAHTIGSVPRPVQLIDPVSRYSNMTLSLPPQDFPVLQADFIHPPDCGETSYIGRGRLAGMRALITGGDSGIGRAIVIAYLREGAHVAINYLPSEEEDAQALSDFVAREGRSIERIPGDLTNETFCGELVAEAHRRLGGLDVLINHAGESGNTQGPNWRPIDRFNTEELELIYRVNVFAPLWLTRAAVPFLPRGGSIIVTSSALVAHPAAGSVLYGSSKAAVTHTMRSIAQQLVPRGIRVNGVAPPLTYTPFLAAGGFTTDMIRAATEGIAIGRPAQPAEIAPFYVDIADPQKTFLSGEVVAITGSFPGF